MTKRTKIGLGITLAWGVVIVVLLITKRHLLGQMTLNEWGDFLAGFVAPVAFFWLILGYFQQGEELRLN